jgi:WD40 repeat protein
LDNTVILWDVATRAKLVSWSGHAGEIYAIAISPDGKLIASGGAGEKDTDKRLIVWSANPKSKTGRTLAADADVYSLAFAKDGKSLAAGMNDGSVRMWNLDRPAQKPTTLGKHGDRVFGVAFSPDGKMLASVSADKTIRLWSTKTRNQLSYKLDGLPRRTVRRRFLARWVDPPDCHRRRQRRFLGCRV